MSALAGRGRRLRAMGLRDVCIVRRAPREGDPPPADWDDPYTDDPPEPCQHMPGGSTEVVEIGGVTLTTRAHVELRADRYGSVHAGDRIRVTGSDDPVRAAGLPVELAVDGEPEMPGSVLVVRVAD